MADRAEVTLSILLIIAVATLPAAGLYCFEKIDLGGLGTQIGSTRFYTNGTAGVWTAGAAARTCNVSCSQDSECRFFMANTQSPTIFSCSLMKGAMDDSMLDVASTRQTVDSSFFCVKAQADWDAIGSQYDRSSWKNGKPEPGVGLDWRCMAEEDVNAENLGPPIKLGNASSLLDMLAACRKACVNAPECQFWTYTNAPWAPNSCYLRRSYEAGYDGTTGPSYKEVFNGSVGQVTCFQDPKTFSNMGQLLEPNVHYVKAGNAYFTLFPEKASWESAQKQCQEYGGALATVRDASDLSMLNSSLLQFLPTRHKSYKRAWLGYKIEPDKTTPGATVIVGQDEDKSVMSDKSLYRLDPEQNSTEQYAARTHVYMWSVRDGNPDDIKADVYLYSANGTHEAFPFICKTSDPIPIAGTEEVTASTASTSSSSGSAAGGGQKGSSKLPVWVPVVIAVVGAVVLAAIGLAVYSKWHKKRTTNRKNREWKDIIYEDGTAAGRSLQGTV